MVLTSEQRQEVEARLQTSESQEWMNTLEEKYAQRTPEAIRELRRGWTLKRIENLLNGTPDEYYESCALLKATDNL